MNGADLRKEHNERLRPAGLKQRYKGMAPDCCGSLRGCQHSSARKVDVGRRISAGAGHNDKGAGHVLLGIEGDSVSQRNRFPF